MNVRFTIALLLTALCSSAADNVKSLFDGRTLAGWIASDGLDPSESWTVETGALVTIPTTKAPKDLVSPTVPDHFELTLSVWLSRGANTGVKYFVWNSQHPLTEAVAKGSSAVGVEFQLVEEESPDAKRLDTRSGALYGLAPVLEVVRTPSETWIPVKLTCKVFACEHWLNGRRLLAFDLKSTEMQARLRETAVSPSGSFSSIIGAAVLLRATGVTRLPPGRISLQHHNTKVMFRDIRLRAIE